MELFAGLKRRAVKTAREKGKERTFLWPLRDKFVSSSRVWEGALWQWILQRSRALAEELFMEADISFNISVITFINTVI